jgi:dihydrofolate reductase/thymidylate synthase
MKKSFSVVLAYEKMDRGIGFCGRLPWFRIKEDMIHFTNITSSTTHSDKMNCVIMGRKTWDSLPDSSKPLPGRYNLVITSNPDKIPDDCMVRGVVSLDQALNYAYNHPMIDQTFVIGGQQTCDQAFNRTDCSKLHLTMIDGMYESDTFMPPIPRTMILRGQESVMTGVGISIVFQTFENISDPESDETQYTDLLKDIIKNGEIKHGRNGMTRSLFGPQHTFDLEKGFPLLTTKRMFFSGIVKELLFFIRGETNSNILSDQGVRIWEQNTTREFLDSRGLDYQAGDMGPMYGYNWRHFGTEYKGCASDHTGQGFDQLSQLIESLTQDPGSRRHLLTTHDPSTVGQSVLAPCHGLTVQFNVRSTGHLDCKMYQRSVDTALGYPFNIASYGLFVHLLCHVTGYRPGKLIMTLGDTHLYETHLDKINRQINRAPLIKPTLEIVKQFDPLTSTVEEKIRYLENVTSDDILLKDYNYWPGIKMDMVA